MRRVGARAEAADAAAKGRKVIRDSCDGCRPDHPHRPPCSYL